MNASQPYQKHLSHSGVQHLRPPLRGNGSCIRLDARRFPTICTSTIGLIPPMHGRQVITFDFLGWGASESRRTTPITSKTARGGTCTRARCPTD